MCSCSGTCGCSPQVRVQPPVRSLPAPIPEITWSVLQLPAGSTPTVVVSGVPPVYHVQIGFPGAFSPVFGTNVIVTTLAPGSPATASIDNTDPLNPILSLGIPRGADGENGWGTAFELLDSFNMPAPGFTTGFVTVGDNRMVEVGTWVKITGFSIEGNWFVVVAKNGDDQMQLRNPGPTDLLPYWGSSATDVPSNAPTGTVFSAGEKGVVVGAPGLRGIQGTGGLTPQVSVVYTVPVSPPVSAADNLVLYFNAAPPSIPTIGRFYSWNGASWDGGPNFVAAGGTITYSGNSNPNTSPPSGAKLLDLYIQFTGTDAVYWQLTSPSTWTTIGTVALLGTATTAASWTGGPGTYTLDLATFSYDIDADSDIELDWDDTNYSGQGTWTVLVRNSNGAAPINVSFATGRWSYLKNLPVAPTPALSLPDTEVVVVTFSRDSFSGLYTIIAFDTLLNI